MLTEIMKKLGGFVLASALVVMMSGAAFAVATTVSCNSTNSPDNHINNNSGTALSAGAFVQIIQSDDASAGAPDASTGVPAGDTVITTGTLATAGNFSGSANITTSKYVYIRAWETWNGSGAPSGRYGTSTPASVGTGFTFTYKPASFATTSHFLSSIAVTPASPTIYAGHTQQFTATGTYSDSSTANITSSVTWTSGTPATATINSSGLATGVAAGTSSITAALSGITSPAQTLTVNANSLVSIAVTPASPTIFAGHTQQFTATGTYADSSTANITSSVTWTSGTPATATINSSGLATGVAAGTSSITASLSGKTSPAQTLTVNANSLVSIAVTPASPTINISATQQFTATGTYADSSTANITSSVTWTSGTPATATINSSGLATGVAAGTSSITAALSGVTSPAQTLTVSAATLVSIAVTPANPTISVGGTQQFTATGTYSSGPTQDITGSVTWSSGTPATATINSSGLATGVAVGSTTISAILSGKTGTATLNVITGGTPPSITSVTTKDTTDTSGYVYDTIDIKGTNFGGGAGSASAPAGSSVELMSQGGSYVTLPDTGGSDDIVFWWQSNKIQVLIPHKVGSTYTVAGTATIRVTTPSGSDTHSFTIKPKVYSVDPNSGQVGTSVAVTGTGFHGTAGSNSVSFNGTTAAATNFSPTSSNETITVAVPTGAVTGQLLVNVNGQSSNTHYDWAPYDQIIFTVSGTVTPHVTGISPTFGEQGQTLPVTISGADVTWSGDMASAVHFSNPGITVNSATGSGTTISANITIATAATTGDGTVTVDGASGSATFTVNIPSPAPVIISITPDKAPAGTRVTVSGLRFGSTQGNSHLDFANISTNASYPAEIDSWSDGIITAIVPRLAAAGTYEVKATKVAVAQGCHCPGIQPDRLPDHGKQRRKRYRHHLPEPVQPEQAIGQHRRDQHQRGGQPRVLHLRHDRPPGQQDLGPEHQPDHLGR